MIDDEKRPHPRNTDPNGYSRNPDDVFAEEGEDLQHVMSPEQTDTGLTEGGPSDHSSSTEVPSNNHEISTSGYQSKEVNEEKHRGMRSKLPKFLGGKKEEKDDKKEKQHFTVWGQLRATLFGSYINVLLIACEYDSRPSRKQLTISSSHRYCLVLRKSQPNRRFRCELYRHHSFGRYVELRD